jgi:hypothetical protein
MPPGMRKAALVTHVGCSVGWIGAVGTSVVVAVVGLADRDPLVVKAAYLTLEPIGWYALVPLSLASLLTGLVQSLGTNWGLLRHYWVVAKLLMNLFATGVLLLYTPRREENVQYFDEQTYPKRVLGIYRSTSPPSDPVAGLKTLEQQRIAAGELPGYHRVRLGEAKNYFASAADWVYQYNTAGGRSQVCDRDFVVNDHLVHGIFWVTPVGEWTANQANWNLIIASFRPGD